MVEIRSDPDPLFFKKKGDKKKERQERQKRKRDKRDKRGKEIKMLEGKRER